MTLDKIIAGLYENKGDYEEVLGYKPSTVLVDFLTGYDWAKKKYDLEAYVLEESLWGKEVEEFYQYLKNYNFKTLIITDTSTGLMRTIENFVRLGASVTGTQTVSKKNKREWDEDKMGIVLNLPDETIGE